MIRKILALFLLANVAAAEQKIAVVDMARIMNESKEAQTKRAELDSVATDAKKKLDTKRDALKKMEEQLQAKKVSEDSPEVEKFRAQARDFARMVKDADEDIKTKYLKVNKALLDKAQTVIEKYAKEQKIDLILDRSEKVRGPIMFASKTQDITDEIAKLMNK
jgi:outer membrane protein